MEFGFWSGLIYYYITKDESIEIEAIHSEHGYVWTYSFTESSIFADYHRVSDNWIPLTGKEMFQALLDHGLDMTFPDTGSYREDIHISYRYSGLINPRNGRITLSWNHVLDTSHRELIISSYLSEKRCTALSSEVLELRKRIAELHHRIEMLENK